MGSSGFLVGRAFWEETCHGIVDKGYHEIKKGKKNKSIEYFVTNGNRIRDAITGARYNYFVGSRDEDFFFKVKYYDNKIKYSIHRYYD